MILEPAVSRLKGLFYTLLEHGQLNDAFVIADAFKRCLHSRIGRTLQASTVHESTMLLRNLLTCSAIGPLTKAKILKSVTEDVDIAIAPNTCREEENIAKELFDQSGHIHGALDINVRQTCRDIKNGVGDLDQAVQLLDGYVETYEAQGDLAGVQHAIKKFKEHITPHQNFELELSLLHMAQEVAKRSGMEVPHVIWSVQIFGTWLNVGGRTARIIERSEALHASLARCDCQWLKGYIAQILAQAHWKIQEYNKAALWADRCRSSWHVCYGEERARAATIHLRAKLHPDIKDDEIQHVVDSANKLIEDEINSGFLEAAMDKIEWICTRVFRPRDPMQSGWLARLEELVPRLPLESSRVGDLRLANLYQNVANARLCAAKTRADTIWEEEVITMSEKAVALYTKHKRVVEAASTLQIHGFAVYSIFEKVPNTQTLERAFELFSSAHDSFRTTATIKMISTSTYWCSLILYTGWSKGWTSTVTALNALLGAETAKTEERIEKSILGGWQALALKQKTSASEEVKSTYDRALNICLSAELPIDLWEWIQKAKTRNLSDLLGLGILVPYELKRAILENGKTKELFEKEERMLRASNKTEPASRLGLRGELHIHQKQMREYPDLKAVMDLREATPIKLPHLHNLTSSINRSGLCSHVTLVDWFFAKDGIYLCAVRDQQQPIVRRCSMNKRELEAWRGKWIDTKDWIRFDDLGEDDPDYCLRQLDSLIQPLAEMTKPEDLLILSPTGVLHSVPIHALWVNGEPLIVRNPIAYCASLTSFAQCVQRAVANEAGGRPKTVMAVYEDTPGTPFSPVEQDRVYTAAKDLGTAIGASVLTGKSVGRKDFDESIQASSLVHFHGHCTFDEAQVTNQCFVLGDGRVAVADLFNLKLRAPHITLIACDSSSQSIAAGDEPLGMVTALLCAGASSVIGTLWTTSSSNGRRFSEHFYSALDESGPSGVLDLAAALRKAVLTIRGNRRTRQPYHWASFVLHGSWFLKK